MLLFFLVFLCGALPDYDHQARTGATPGRDEAVLEAIVRDFVQKRLSLSETLDPEGRAPSQIHLSGETLTVCAGARGRCIGNNVIQIAQRHAAAAKWPPVLSGDLARLKQSIRFREVRAKGVTVVERLEDLSKAQFALAISAPVYFSNQSLVYVQVGRPHNTSGWLLLLQDERNGDWRIALEVAVSNGN